MNVKRFPDVTLSTNVVLTVVTTIAADGQRSSAVSVVFSPSRRYPSPVVTVTGLALAFREPPASKIFGRSTPLTQANDRAHKSIHGMSFKSSKRCIAS